MITIIHGEDTALSRQFLLEQKRQYKEIVEFSANDLQISDLLQITSGGSLFSSNRAIFIENLLSTKKSKDNKEISDYIKNNHKNFEFFLWENSELSKATLSQFLSARVNVFKLPQNLFGFLDSLGSTDKNSIIYFHKTLETSNQELVFYMLVRQFRLMLGVLSNDEQIDELKKLAPWQKEKLAKQAKSIGEEKLIELIKKLHRIDLGQKSGQTGLTLIQAIDIFLLSM